MKRIALMIAAYVGACGLTACTQPHTGDDTFVQITNTIDKTCVESKYGYLGLDAHTFENDKAKGWRKVADQDGCVLSAAALLNEYRTIILGDQIDGMMWHEAQLRASAGQTEQAIHLFEQTRHNSPLSDQHYRDATIAYLKQDKASLMTARGALARVPQPESFKKGVEQFKKQFPDAPVPAWPMNLDVVDGFIACFDKPYKEAYSMECRPE